MFQLLRLIYHKQQYVHLQGLIFFHLHLMPLLLYLIEYQCCVTFTNDEEKLKKRLLQKLERVRDRELFDKQISQINISIKNELLAYFDKL